jgi:hypothetical protein
VSRQEIETVPSGSAALYLLGRGGLPSTRLPTVKPGKSGLTAGPWPGAFTAATGSQVRAALGQRPPRNGDRSDRLQTAQTTHLYIFAVLDRRPDSETGT